MFRNVFTVAALALAGLASTGCGGAGDDNALRSPPASAIPQRTPIDATAPSERLYFGVTNRLHVASDVLADVNLNVGARVQLEAATSDGSPIRFELWMVHADKEVELLNAFDVDSGFVLTTIDNQTGDGRYFVHFPAPTSTRDVVVHMDCQRTNGRCTDDLQPGEGCYAGHDCSAGLVCSPAGTACDPTWVGGTCVIPNAGDAACVNETHAPTCGCDGVTYASACLARSAGAGVRSSGGCVGVAPPI